MFSILKVCTYRKMNSINEILNRTCYLIFVPVASVLYRDDSETEKFGVKNRDNCLQFVDCIFHDPWGSKFILNQFCLEW